MDRVSERDRERDRSSRSSRNEREKERERDRRSHHHDRARDRDRDRDRDHKHRNHHGEKHLEEKRHGSKGDTREDDDDNHYNGEQRSHDSGNSIEKSELEKNSERDPDRSRKRYSDGSKDEKQHKDENHSPRFKEDSLEKDGRRHGSSADRLRDSVERFKDEKNRSGDRRSLERSRDTVERSNDADRRHHSRANSRKSLDGFGDSVEQDRELVDRSTEKHHRSSRKRKGHDGGDDEPDKRGKLVKVSDGKREAARERSRFEDQVDEDEVDAQEQEDQFTDVKEGKENSRKRKGGFGDEDYRTGMREKRRFSDSTKVDNKRDEQRFSDKVKKENLGNSEEVKPSVLLENLTSNVKLEKSSSTNNVVSREQHTLPLNALTNAAASDHPFPTKVSSINTTNENGGVSITRFDEVTGKSRTDGTTASVSVKSGFSLDALARAKKALQMRKELSEKMKKFPELNKVATASNKDGIKAVTSIASTASAVSMPVQATSNTPSLAAIPNIDAVKRAQELAAKMGFRQDPEFAPLINMFPGPVTSDTAVPQRGSSKAPVLRLDAQGREIDEHGNIINMPKLTNLSTLKVNINKQKKEAFQILRPDLDADMESNPHFDERMGLDKTKLLRPKRMAFQFVEEGRWSKQAEIIKFKNQFGEAQAKELKTKQSQFAKAKAEVDNPNLIEVAERVDRVPKERKKDEIPQIEWWDKPLLPSGTYMGSSSGELNMEKITIYVEHPRPIEPPAEPAPPPPQPLKLTKKEQKKLRTQRRLAKEKDRQEMIRQGLLEPPKPKVKMSNLMKVLGSEATQDPTRLEMEVRAAAADRQQAHDDRNVARKLTPAERREKKERKLFDDPTTLETFVSVYKMKDLSHPQTRFKVDVNAQENRLTGVAVISDTMSVVVVEGGKKPVKRYGKLMLKRINWATAVGDDAAGAEDGDKNPGNRCDLVWQGSVAKPSFRRFHVHQCRTEAAAKKVFADTGVPHYWDLAVNFSDELM